MSQQEFVPQSQGKSEQYLEEEEENYGQTYRVEKSKTSDMPKSEHPSTYEDSVPPYSYRAQDSVADTQSPIQRERPASRQRQQQQFSPDGDAFESSYQPYRSQQQQQVPPWARPQRNNKPILRWVVLILLGLALIKFILPIIAFVGIVLVGGILLLLTIVLGILVALVIPVLIILGMLGVPWRLWWFRGNSFRRWRGNW